MTTLSAAKAELIRKIESLPDEEGGAEIVNLLETLRQMNEALSRTIEHEAQRAKNWQVTVEAMEAARRGEVKRFGTIEEMFADLHADD
jgi:hypothetical protein